MRGAFCNRRLNRKGNTCRLVRDKEGRPRFQCRMEHEMLLKSLVRTDVLSVTRRRFPIA